MGSSWRLPRGFVLLYAIGSVLLFGSWFASNVMSARWLGEMQDRERVLNSITLSEISRSQWLREYNTQVTVNQSRELTGLAAYHLLAETEQVLAGIETSLEDDSIVRQRIIGDKNSRLARAEAWFREGNYEQVVQELNRVTAKYDHDVVPKTSKAASRWDEARLTTKKWGVAFVVLYVIGAALVACGFVLKECRVPSNEALQPTARKAHRG